MVRASAHSGTGLLHWPRHLRPPAHPIAAPPGARFPLPQTEAEAIAAGERAALRLTQDVQRRVERLETLLRTSLTRDPRVEIESLRPPPVMPPPHPELPPPPPPVPAFRHFVPDPPSAFGKVTRSLLGNRRRHRAAMRRAEKAFARAAERHRLEVAEHERQVAQARRAHHELVAEAERRAADHQAGIAALAEQIRRGDRHAVGELMDAVLRESPYPAGFPGDRKTGYVPESHLLVVECELPTVKIVPAEKSVHYDHGNAAFRRTLRAENDIRRLYEKVIAQIALRTLREVFDADPYDLISTVVFNGYVDAVDPVIGDRIRPHLITLRATREQFAPVVLDRVDPMQCLRKHFFADVSPRPEELIPIEPIRRFRLTDPGAGAADGPPAEPGAEAGLAGLAGLTGLTDMEFEALVQNLFSKIGYATKLFEADGRGGFHCLAYDPRPIVGGRCVVHARLTSGTVEHTEVSALYEAVRREGATKGILITTSGYGPSSYQFAAAKPLSLVDGSGLRALCHEYGIPVPAAGPDTTES